MRAVLTLGLLLFAAPAMGQDWNGVSQSQLDDLRMQQQLAQQRAISQANELMALEARLRAEQAVAEAQSQRIPLRLPQLPYPGAPVARIDTSQLPSIPDAALEASNRRVRAAAERR